MSKWLRVEEIRVMLPGISVSHIYRLANIDYWRRKRDGHRVLYRFEDVRHTLETRSLAKRQRQ